MMGIGMASYEKWYNAEKDDSVIKQVLQSLWKGREYFQVSHTGENVRLDEHNMFYSTSVFSQSELKA